MNKSKCANCKHKKLSLADDPCRYCTEPQRGKFFEPISKPIPIHEDTEAVKELLCECLRKLNKD